MEEIFLEAQARQEIGSAKSNKIRREGFIPAVVYAQGKSPLVVKLSHKEVWGLVHQHRLENSVINLKLKADLKSKNASLPCLIKEIQYDPVQGDIIHIDFNEVSLTKVVKVNVPVKAVGEPIGVKQEGGSLEHILWEVEVECLPTDIPEKIEVDVSGLKIGDAVHVKDMPIAGNIKIITSADSIVISLAAPIKEEVVAEVVEGEEAKEPEVIKEKKEVPVEEGAEAEDKGKEKEKK